MKQEMSASCDKLANKWFLRRLKMPKTFLPLRFLNRKYAKTIK